MCGQYITLDKFSHRNEYRLTRDIWQIVESRQFVPNFSVDPITEVGMFQLEGPYLLVSHTFLRALALARLAGVGARACASKGLARGIDGRSSRVAERRAIVGQVAHGRNARAQCVPRLLTSGTVFEVEATSFNRGRAAFLLSEGSSGGWNKFHVLQAIAGVVDNLKTEV